MFRELLLGLEVSPLGPALDTITVPVTNYFRGQTFDHVMLDIQDGRHLHVVNEEIPAKEEDRLRFIVMSDTHWKHHVMTIPDGDVLVHCGDMFLKGGSESQLTKFLNFFSQQPHRVKIMVGGNHDLILETLGKERIKEMCEACGVIYLENDAVEVEGFKIFGTPFSFLSRTNNSAFQSPSANQVLSQIPNDIHILVSHQALKDVKCRLNLCGHIHARRGFQQRNRDGKVTINAAICDGRFRPLNTAFVVDLKLSKE